MTDVLHLPTGKRPATYSSADLRYADVRPKGLSLPKIPAPRGGFGRDFPDWLMLGNGPDDTVFPGFAGAGDCFWAGQSHATMEANRNAGRQVPRFTGASVIAQYSGYCGYDPHTGANDAGTDVREGLRIHQHSGIVDADGQAHRIGPYFSIEPGNLQHLWEVLWLAECIGVGLAPFPESAMDQFARGQTWSYVPGSPTDGGHWIIVVGHPVENTWTGVTWGRRQTMTPPFLSHTVDELWAWIDPDRYSRVTGKTFEGIAGADLEQFLQLAAARISGRD